MQPRTRLERLRAEQVLLRAGVSEPSVDVVYVATRFGVEVRKVPGTAWEGAIDMGRPGEPPTIYVRDAEDWNAQRLTIAHALGHYFLHRDQQEAFRDYRNAQSKDPREAEARKFAAELLMPAPWLEAFARYESARQLAARFEVPLEAMKDRLAQLDIPARGTATGLKVASV